VIILKLDMALLSHYIDLKKIQTKLS